MILVVFPVTPPFINLVNTVAVLVLYSAHAPALKCPLPAAICIYLVVLAAIDLDLAAAWIYPAYAPFDCSTP
jgi:hypothetical protein